MHYHIEVLINEKDNVEKCIKKVLEPYKDKIWDWYQIGGRWTGAHIPGYDPDADPAHKEKCSLCGGTGKRKDLFFLPSVEDLEAWMKRNNGCNRCHGTGIAVKWPTQWKPQEMDVIPLSEIPDGFTCHTLIVTFPKEQLFVTESFDSEKCEFIANPEFKKGRVSAKLKELGVTTGFLVTVDCHN